MKGNSFRAKLSAAVRQDETVRARNGRLPLMAGLARLAPCRPRG
jgi:hypothetical protein